MTAKERDNKRATENRRRLDLYKLQEGCSDCGYRTDAAALEFDHLPGFEKCRTVASCCYAAWTVIWEEVLKCEVVCANCHAIRTNKRRNDLRASGGTADTLHLECSASA